MNRHPRGWNLKHSIMKYYQNRVRHLLPVMAPRHCFLLKGNTVSQEDGWFRSRARNVQDVPGTTCHFRKWGGCSPQKYSGTNLYVLPLAKDGTIWWIEKSWQWIKTHQNTLKHSHLYIIEVGVGAESWQWIKTHQVNLNSWVHDDTKIACVPNVRCYRINSLLWMLTVKAKNQDRSYFSHVTCP